MSRSLVAALSLTLSLCLALTSNADASAAEPKRVLLVTTTLGFRHSSIPLAEQTLFELAKQSGKFVVTSTTDHPDYPEYGKGGEQEAVAKVLADAMSASALKNYDGIFFLHTSGQLPIPDVTALLDWVRAGHGVMGSHAASDCFHETDRPGKAHSFIEMLGGQFRTHGRQETVELHNVDPEHPANKLLEKVWVAHDEMYLFKNYERTKVHSLLNMKEHPNERTPGHYPVSWCKNYGKGRVFYTSLGHREDVWDAHWRAGSDDRQNGPDVPEKFRLHLLGGIHWALGLEDGDATPQVR